VTTQSAVEPYPPPEVMLVEDLGLEYDFELIRITLEGRVVFAIEGGRERLRPDMTMLEFLKLLSGNARRRFVEFYAPLYARKNFSASA